MLLMAREMGGLINVGEFFDEAIPVIGERGFKGLGKG